jgi:DNA uptake protein ComE-like DNA-binding protein
MEINLNTAELADLTKLKNIGPVRAQSIIDKRPYRDIYELSTIKGLGKKRIDEIVNQGLAKI